MCVSIFFFTFLCNSMQLKITGIAIVFFLYSFFKYSIECYVFNIIFKLNAKAKVFEYIVVFAFTRNAKTWLELKKISRSFLF